MKKHIMGLYAATLLFGAFAAVPSVSAASTLEEILNQFNGNTNEAIWRNQNPYHYTDSKENAGNNVSGTDDVSDHTGASPNVPDNGATPNTDPNETQTDGDAEKAIAEGMKYIGTPYEFGSDRSTTTTFDCSDLVRWMFKQSLGIVLPYDSRGRGAYVKEHGAAQTDWRKLKRGDLMFFMTYRGSDAAAYAGIDKSDERITHVGVYLGDGKILHTYSNESGGVKVGTFANTSWEQRFLFGGSVVNEKTAE